jgi:Divergent InlB B-repeat domain
VVRPALLLAAILLVLAAPASAAAGGASTPELIGQAEQSGKIGPARADLYLAYALAEPHRLPRAYRSRAPWDGTLPLLHLRQRLRRAPRSPERAAARAALAPPSGGPSCSSSSGSLPNSVQSGHFYIQYGTIGGGLNIGSYASSLDGAWEKETNPEGGAPPGFGWAVPPTKNSPPGGKYHVRIDSLGGGLYGYVDVIGTYAGSVGDNPNTGWNEGDAEASCMVLNRDYSGFPSSPQASLDSTTAHEFNHSIQFGYGALSGPNLPDDVFVEGGATWMEDEVYDSANDNYNYLWPVFGDSMGDYDNSPYPYWIAFRGLTERYGTGTSGGGEQVMQDFWELTSKNSASNLDAINQALQLKDAGTSLAAAYHAYAIAAKFLKTCGGGYVLPYCFQEAAGYLANAGPTAVQSTITSVPGATSGSASIEDNFALNWVALPGSGGPYDVTVQNTSGGGSFRATVACDTGSALALFPAGSALGAGGSATVSGFDPSSCSTPVAVITNQTQTAANPTSSSARSYRVSVAASGGGGGGGGGSTATLIVTRAGTGSGTVTSSPAGINCGPDCSENYATGASVNLTATPAVGSTFAGWSGACTGVGPCSVTMDAATAVTATFNVTSGGGGGESGGGGGGTTGGTTGTTIPPPPVLIDAVKPVLSALSLSRTAFRAARSGPSIAAVGTRVRYFLSELATTYFRVYRRTVGARVGGRCVRRTARYRDRKRCIRYVRLRGRFSHEGVAGANAFRFRGRLAGRRLRPGRYRLTGRPKDDAGNLGKTRRVRFRILP